MCPRLVLEKARGAHTIAPQIGRPPSIANPVHAAKEMGEGVIVGLELHYFSECFLRGVFSLMKQQFRN
jgi:hypothetical protein